MCDYAATLSPKACRLPSLQHCTCWHTRTQVAARACSVRMDGMRCIRWQVTYAVIDPHVMAVSPSPLIAERTVAVHVLTDKPLTQAYLEYPTSFYPTSTPVRCSTM